jgi:(3R)-3-hydroxyacyl-CoA dehydrogenase / 3a,7a,12a-trihydroxy-5b-cholest-24-enoyl-CoA hydratase / enoyl-CoA hydratase 2
MAEQLRFDDRVVIVTGAGQGLGRAHALLFASRGARVVCNDLGCSTEGGGKTSEAADAVVAAIKAAGGQAVASYDSVEDGARIVQCALDSFGRIDVVVNNAGILRDVSFPKMTAEDWDLVYRVHLLGSYRVTAAAWPHLRDQGYGRVVMTSSAAGLYGNFGQANYGTVKAGLFGFGNTLALEGARRNVHVNTIAPVAGSRMTETILPPELVTALRPEVVSPLVAWLCHESCEENGGLFEVGGGFFGKLRWERAKGQLWRVGRSLSPEDVKSAWPVITSFEKSSHPQSVAESLQPIVENAQAGPSQGGNQYIDVDLALGYEFPEMKSRYDQRDISLYALGVGAATDPLDGKDLQLVYEAHGEGFKVLPTYAVIPALNIIVDALRQGQNAPGLHFGLDRVLHGEQYTEVARPLPASAELTHRVKVKEIFDKGKGALVVFEVKSLEPDGDLLMRNEVTIFIKGAGGWGGERGVAHEIPVPERAPDAVREQRISPNQALLYRLSGDWNPLHADPGFAKAFGFERPILHGLCTYGFAARHVISAFCDGDPRLFRSIRARFAESVFPGETVQTEMWRESKTRIVFRCKVKERFAESVFPGETVQTEMWRESKTRIVFRCKVKERDKVIINNAAVELYPEIPKKKERAAAPEAKSKAETGGLSSGDIFVAIRDWVSKNPEVVGKVATVYQFKLTSPESVWTLDLKNGKGAVEPGEAQKPDCTLELSDANFLLMTSGKADPMKLFTGGQLKISGNILASQKLNFLQKIDPRQAQAAIEAARKAPAAAAAPAAKERLAPAIFEKLGARLKSGEGRRGAPKESPSGAVLRFRVDSEEWTVDLKQGRVEKGAVGTADATLILDDASLVTLARGTQAAQDLFQRGLLRVEGDLRAARQLGFLSGGAQ